MKDFVRPVFILLAAVIFNGFSPTFALAHDDAEPLWAMNSTELAELETTIEQHRVELLTALNAAIEAGVLVSGQQRDYRFDSNSEVVDIPRSVLNRVILASLELETASMKKYLSCGAGCDHSLEKDLAGDPGQKEAVSAIRTLWPKMKASFAILWRDIPVGIWMRTINAARYSRSLVASARYQSKAYGGLSMAMGATAFGAAFTVTEIAESMFMGPLHFVCKANYFWSVAFGAAVAGLARDLKTLLLFEKDGQSIAKRVSRAFTDFSSLKRSQGLEKRILFRTLSDGGVEQFEKITKRNAHSGVLEPLLDRISAGQAVAVDPLLWSELAATISKPADRRFRFANDAREFLFQSEIAAIYSLPAPAARIRWQDISASMRSTLKIFRNGLEVRHQLHKDAGDALKALGELDMLLRTLDLFNVAWLSQNAGRHGIVETETNTTWLRNVVTEWMSLAIETTASDADLRAVQIKRNNLAAILDASVRRGQPIAIAPEGAQHLESALRKEIETAASRLRTCDALFAPAI